MYEKVKQFVEERKIIKISLLSKNEDVINYINKITSHIENITLKERLYLVYHKLDHPPVCPECNINYMKFYNNGYNRLCSKKCSSKAMVRKVKATKIKRYGRINTNTPEVLFAKYGVYNISQLPGVAAKISKTKQSFTKEKNNIINTKRNNTNLERIGVTHPQKSSIIVKQTKQTNLNKYGHISTFQNETKKSRKYWLVHYKKSFHTLINICNKHNYVMLFNFREYIKYKRNKQQGKHIPIKCNICGWEWNVSGISNFYGCYKCKPKYKISENKLIEFIKDYNINYQTNLRSIIPPLEVDIFIPERQLAIEFNGLYWHSEANNTGKNYHLTKTNLCKNKNIQLIHIFEDEWLYKQQIVKNRLKNVLGLIKYKIPARKCIIKELDNCLKSKFLNKYHIQGDDHSSIRLGLFYSSRLVAIMTFGKSRYNKNYQYELIRFCTIGNFNIIGAAGKLFSYFIKNYNPETIISYADKRWSKNGNLYIQLGFNQQKDTPPNYFYVNKGVRESRQKYQKHKQQKILEKFDNSLSEHENMANNNYFRIWDCGNYVFEWRNNNKITINI